MPSNYGCKKQWWNRFKVGVSISCSKDNGNSNSFCGGWMMDWQVAHWSAPLYLQLSLVNLTLSTTYSYNLGQIKITCTDRQCRCIRMFTYSTVLLPSHLKKTDLKIQRRRLSNHTHISGSMSVSFTEFVRRIWNWQGLLVNPEAGTGSLDWLRDFNLNEVHHKTAGTRDQRHCFSLFRCRARITLAKGGVV